jgi:hypothetical protein
MELLASISFLIADEISTGWSSLLKVLENAPVTMRSKPFSKFSRKPKEVLP